MFSECWTSPVTHSICLHVSARSADFTVQSGIFNPPGQQHLNPMCQTHTQTLLQKSGDDYFKQTKFLLSWKWKSQIPKSITHKNPPALPFLPIRTACDFSWFQDFNTTFFFFFPNTAFPGSWLWWQDMYSELCGGVCMNTSFQRKSDFLFSGNISPEYTDQRGTWGMAAVDPGAPG